MCKEELRAALIEGGVSELEIDEMKFVKFATPSGEEGDWEAVPYIPEDATHHVIVANGEEMCDDVELIILGETHNNVYKKIKKHLDDWMDAYEGGEKAFLAMLQDHIEKGELKCFIYTRLDGRHYSIKKWIEESTWNVQDNDSVDSIFEEEYDKGDFMRFLVTMELPHRWLHLADVIDTDKLKAKFEELKAMQTKK